MNEAETRAEHIDPALRAAGWGEVDGSRVLREHGIRCPDDVSIVGHNDMPFVDALTPPLTTIRIPVHDMGEQAAELLLRRIAKPLTASVVVELRPELVVRGSA